MNTYNYLFFKIQMVLNRHNITEFLKIQMALNPQNIKNKSSKFLSNLFFRLISYQTKSWNQSQNLYKIKTLPPFLGTLIAGTLWYVQSALSEREVSHLIFWSKPSVYSTVFNFSSVDLRSILNSHFKISSNKDLKNI